jgi:Flp pilus assembly protein TadD
VTDTDWVSTPRRARARVSIAVRVPAVLVCLVTLALGCASAPWRRDRVGITLDELLAGAPLGVEQDSPALVDEEAVLAVSAGMQDFLNAHVARTADRATRLRQLAYAIVGQGSFGLEYDETTRTAPETFRARRGNCLSFSNMFVAMARHVGLDARYQEVDTPPDWSFRDDAFVLNRHVNVVVDLGREGEHVVDFNMDDFRTSYDRRRIQDGRAMAHYYNNMGVERMQAGDTASALPYFRRATGHDPLFSPAWTNLGILYWRKGHLAYAEAAYLQALKADGGHLVAMSNLASLYERLGDQERAALYRSRVIDHRERNPYYRFQLAREAFLAQDYDGAISHLNYAIRKKKNEDQFYSLLGLSHLKKGDEQAARRWLSRAEEVAATDALKRRYASKIDILLSAPPGQDRP